MSTNLVVHRGSFFHVQFHEGIFYLHLDKDVVGSADQAWEWMNCIQDIRSALDRPFPLLTLVDKKVQFSSGGRKVMRLFEDDELFVAHAMHTPSAPKKVMVKFLMILVPSNLFDEDVFLKKENAVKWLKNKAAHSRHACVISSEAKQLRIEVNSAARRA